MRLADHAASEPGATVPYMTCTSRQHRIQCRLGTPLAARVRHAFDVLALTRRFCTADFVAGLRECDSKSHGSAARAP
jgi:hypothetical protein